MVLLQSGLSFSISPGTCTCVYARERFSGLRAECFDTPELFLPYVSIQFGNINLGFALSGWFYRVWLDYTVLVQRWVALSLSHSNGRANVIEFGQNTSHATDVQEGKKHFPCLYVLTQDPSKQQRLSLAASAGPRVSHQCTYGVGRALQRFRQYSRSWRPVCRNFSFMEWKLASCNNNSISLVFPCT